MSIQCTKPRWADLDDTPEDANMAAAAMVASWLRQDVRPQAWNAHLLRTVHEEVSPGSADDSDDSDEDFVDIVDETEKSWLTASRTLPKTHKLEGPSSCEQASTCAPSNAGSRGSSPSASSCSSKLQKARWCDIEDGPEIDLPSPAAAKASAADAEDSPSLNSRSAWTQSIVLSWAERLRCSLSEKAPQAEAKLRMNVVSARREQLLKVYTSDHDSHYNQRSSGTTRKNERRGGKDSSTYRQIGVTKLNKNPRRVTDGRPNSRIGVTEPFKHVQNDVLDSGKYPLGVADDWRASPRRDANECVQNCNIDSGKNPNPRRGVHKWHKDPQKGAKISFNCAQNGNNDWAKDPRSTTGGMQTSPRKSTSEFVKNKQNGGTEAGKNARSGPNGRQQRNIAADSGKNPQNRGNTFQTQRTTNRSRDNGSGC